MNTSEKPSFLSTLFGRSVRRPAPSSDSSIPTSSNGGSSIAREEPNLNGSPLPTPSQSLCYLSPTTVESSFSQLSRPSNSCTTDGRKRPLANPETISTLSNGGGFFMSDAAKRFKAPSANTSLVAEPVSRLDLPRLDTTWSAGMGLSSPSNRSFSSCSSVRSIRSRITRPSSRTSVLSSKTAALLGQIEKVSTPAHDARRMPMLRVGLTKERWSVGGSNTSAVAPPLNRLSTVPSRYQIMSSLITPMQKKPYWRDASRPEKVTETESTDDVALIPSHSSLPSITQLGSNGENGDTNGVHDRPKHQSVLKGPDGCNVNSGRNKYSANDIEDDEGDKDSIEALDKVKGLTQFKFALPLKGFLAKDVPSTFSFNKPAKITDRIDEESEVSDESDSDESNSSGTGATSDSDSDSNNKKNTTEKTSDTSTSAENTTPETSNEEKKKSPSISSLLPKMPPPTEAVKPFTVSVSEGSNLNIGTNKDGMKITNSPFTISSLPSSSSSSEWNCDTCFVPNKATDTKCAACSSAKPGLSSKWDCNVCFVNNEASASKCASCETIKPGTSVAPSASSTNVFGDKAFKPKPSAAIGISFGFGVAPTSSSTTSTPSSVSLSTNVPATTSFAGFSFGVDKSTTSTSSNSSTLPSTTIPTITVSSATPLFGTSITASKPLFGSNGGFKFGAAPSNGESTSTSISSLTPKPTTTPSISIPAFDIIPAAPTPSAPTLSLPISSAPISFGSTPISTSSTTSSNIFNAPKANLFGSTVNPPLLNTSSSTTTSSAPLFGSSTSTTSLFGSSSTSSTTPSAPLFGSSSVVSSTSTVGSSTSTPLSFAFGGVTSNTSEPSKPLFSIGESKPFAFGGTKPMDDDGPGAKKPMFGQSVTPSLGFSFGQSSTTNNLFGSSSSSSLGQSSSTPSFSSIAPPPSTFQFGEPSTIAPPSTFNFGTTAPSSSTPFVFGAAPTAQPFGSTPFGVQSQSMNTFTAPIPPSDTGSTTNMFAFSGPTGGRKTVTAKRRLPKK